MLEPSRVKSFETRLNTLLIKNIKIWARKFIDLSKPEGNPVCVTCLEITIAKFEGHSIDNRSHRRVNTLTLIKYNVSCCTPSLCNLLPLSLSLALQVSFSRWPSRTVYMDAYRGTSSWIIARVAIIIVPCSDCKSVLICRAAWNLSCGIVGQWIIEGCIYIYIYIQRWDAIKEMVGIEKGRGFRKEQKEDRENKRKASLRSRIVPTSNRFDLCTDEEQRLEDVVSTARISSDGEK